MTVSVMCVSNARLSVHQLCTVVLMCSDNPAGSKCVSHHLLDYNISCLTIWHKYTHTHKLRPHIHNKTDIMVETFVQWKVRNTHTHKVFHLKCCEIEALSSLEHLQRGLQNKHLFSPCLGRTISREKIGILTVMSFPSITACVVSYCEGVGEKQLLQTLNQHLYSNVFKLQWGAQRKLIKNEIIAI